MSASESNNKFAALMAARKDQVTALAQASTGTTAGGNIATGMASTSNSVHSMPEQFVSVKGELDKELAAECIAVFEDNEFRPVRWAIRSKGGKFQAVDGFFYCKTAEDVALIEGYEKRRKVTRVVIDEKK